MKTIQQKQKNWYNLFNIERTINKYNEYSLQVAYISMRQNLEPYFWSTTCFYLYLFLFAVIKNLHVKGEMKTRRFKIC